MILLITGAARGLGLRLVARAAEEGHQAIACVRNADSPSPELAGLAEAFPGRVRIEQLDVESE